MPDPSGTNHITTAATTRRGRERGYILVMFSLGLVFLLGMTGLGVDMGHLYVAKSEAQAFADAAAFNAAVELSKQPGVFAAARSAAAATPVQWNFGTRAFTDVTTLFGTAAGDTFVANPPGAGHVATDYTFAQVTAGASVPLFLLSVVTGRGTSTVRAMSVAGRMAMNANSGGEFPFSPVSRASRPDCASDPFGFCAGQSYTLRWPPSGQAKGTVCSSDTWSDRGTWGQQWRGYCCVTGNNVPNIYRAIMLGTGTVPLAVGDALPDPPGQKNAVDIATYIGYDSDHTTQNYASYISGGTGNGKRIVIVPVNNPATQKVAGFAGFFLPPASQVGSKEVCGTYIGAMVKGLPGYPPMSGSGTFRLRMFQ